MTVLRIEAVEIAFMLYKPLPSPVNNFDVIEFAVIVFILAAPFTVKVPFTVTGAPA